MSGKRVKADICPVCDGAVLAPDTVEAHLSREHNVSVTVIVYPIPDRLMPGVPAVPLEVDDATAERLVASGAFTQAAPSDAAEPAIALSDDARAALDHFSPAAEPAAATEG